MSDTQDVIAQLIYKDITGTITEAEQEELFLIMKDNEEARKMWDELNTAEVRTYIAEQNVPGFADGVIGQLKFRRRRNVVRQLSMAAVLTGLAIGVAWMYGYRKTVPNVVDGVQLVLPGGERVALGHGKQSIHVGGVTIKSGVREMSYVAGKELNDKYAVLFVPAGKDYTVTLSDGSVIQLNAESQLRFPVNFGGTLRDVFIEGEAFVQVAKDAQHPFTVHLPTAHVQVLGTSFNVNTYDSAAAKVALVEGAVRLVNKQDSVVLKPGEQAVSHDRISVSQFDAYETLSWREGKYVLDNVRMDDLCKMISKWYGIEVKMDNVQVGEKRFSGLMINIHEPLEQLLEVLKATNGIDYYTGNDGLIHIK